MSDILTTLAACVEPGQLLTEPDLVSPYLREIGGREVGSALAVARPTNVLQVQALVRACRDRDIAIIPQGGNTGLTGAALPRDRKRHLLLSLSRMNAIRALDSRGSTVIAEAGCPLKTLQDRARADGLFLPLGLGSEGSCTVGGIASTNAGGLRAVRYGNARENILGIEAVLPDGSLFEGLRTLRKHNMGYDLKQLLIGSEGTLGVITAVAIRLVPVWTDSQAALVACPSVSACTDLFTRLRTKHGDAIVAFELIDAAAMSLANAAPSAPPLPFSRNWPAYALIELAGSGADGGVRAMLEEALTEAVSDELVTDAVLASSVRQSATFWAIREAIVDGQRGAGYSVKLDVSVPVGRIAEFIDEASQAAQRATPTSRPIAFGHAGDGNIHFSVLQPALEDSTAFRSAAGSLTQTIHDIALSMAGSISAEHGIGHYKREEFDRVVAPVERQLMWKIKHAIDPRGIMNPGAILLETGPSESRLAGAA